jgi:hypothetical protein
MYRSCITHEVETCPREPCKELHGKQVTFEAIAASAGRDEVPRGVCSTVADGLHVIERGGIESERLSAVDAATAAVAHRRLFYGALSFDVAVASGGQPILTLAAGTAWETAWRTVMGVVNQSWRATKSGHCTSRTKTTPRREPSARAGCVVRGN